MDMWKDIKGYEGFYQVSISGEVRSVDRIIRGRYNKDRIFYGKVLKPVKNASGYLYVHLRKPGTGKSFLVHRLVALNFIDNPENKETVNHIDGNKLNNNVRNLEWATRSEQTIHAYKTCLHGKDKNKGVSNGRAKLKESEVTQIRELGAYGFTLGELAKMYGMSRSAIFSIVSRENWSHVK